jgi:hypothetical protein
MQKLNILHNFIYSRFSTFLHIYNVYVMNHNDNKNWQKYLIRDQGQRSCSPGTPQIFREGMKLHSRTVPL